MGVAVQQPETLNLEQIQALLDGCQSVSFQLDSQAAKYAVVNAVLQHHHYAGQPRAVKGLLRRFLAKLSGLSRAQLTRLTKMASPLGAIVGEKGCMALPPVSCRISPSGNPTSNSCASPLR